MKLTIEPTDSKDYRTVSISVPGDDLSIDKVVEMFRAALHGLGFHPEHIKEAVGEDG